MQFINQSPIIYNICGKSGSGKSKMASYIAEYYEARGKRVISLQYSYYIKEYAKKILGWDGLEETKPRDFLNEVGVELIKDTIDPYFSIRRLIEDVKVYSYFYDVITISDARFEEEIIELNRNFPHTVTIHITGNREEKTLTEKQKKHRTNHGLDTFHTYDYEMVNNENLEALKEKTNKLIEEVQNEY